MLKYVINLVNVKNKGIHGLSNPMQPRKTYMSCSRYINKDTSFYYCPAEVRQGVKCFKRLLRPSPLRSTFLIVSETDISQFFVKMALGLFFCHVYVAEYGTANFKQN